MLYAVPVLVSDGFGGTAIEWHIRRGGIGCTYEPDDTIATGPTEPEAWIAAWEAA